jgi:alginate O-acetyltransferase complex protein AlgI
MMSAWALMWAISLAAYFLFKGMSIMRCSSATLASPQALTYIFCWVGMDPEPFFIRTRVAVTDFSMLFGGIINFLFGVILLMVSGLIAPQYWLLQGWITCIGISFILHFGICKVLAWEMRRRGFLVKPVMNNPVAARSISEFWSTRWNLAFNQLVHPLIYAPLRSRLGSAQAMFLTFFFSGLIHEAVISVPAKAGWGLPTLYFMFQPVGIVIERSSIFKSMGTGVRRLLAWLFVAGPAPILFHPPFMKAVILPFADAIRSLW